MEKADGPRPAGGVTLGVALGLALLAGGLAWLALQARGAAAFDAEEVLAELYPAGRPLGLALVESGALLSGDRFLRLKPEALERADGEPLPEEVVLAFYASPEEVRRAFAGSGGAEMDAARANAERLEAWTRDPSAAAHVEVERGEVTFGAWRAPFVRRRALLAGGGTREASCVDLSTPGRPLVLYALWPDGREASRTVLRDLLAGVTLPEPEKEPER